MTQMSLKKTKCDLENRYIKLKLLLEIDCDLDKMDDTSHLYVCTYYINIFM